MPRATVCKPWTPEEIATIERMYAERASDAEIARHLEGRTVRAVAQRRQVLGLVSCKPARTPAGWVKRAQVLEAALDVVIAMCRAGDSTHDIADEARRALAKAPQP